MSNSMRDAMLCTKVGIEREIARKDKIHVSVEQQIRRLSRTWDSIADNWDRIGYLRDLKSKLSSEIDELANRVA